jgi:penicillin amidase
LHDAILSPLLEPCRRLDGRFGYWWFNGEEAIRRLLEERPPHLLPPGHDDWASFIASILRDVVGDVGDAPWPGLELPWGDVNVASIEHPLARGAPQMARMLNMPKDRLAGHPYAVRVATPSYGASLRMVVSPGREQHGILQIPAGQSGHPMSPNYRSSHADWLRGVPTPFLAGEPAEQIDLRPE